MNRRKPKEPHEERPRNGIRGRQQQQEPEHAVEHGRETEKKPEEACQNTGEHTYACPSAPLMLSLHGPSVALDRKSTKKFYLGRLTHFWSGLALIHLPTHRGPRLPLLPHSVSFTDRLTQQRGLRFPRLARPISPSIHGVNNLLTPDPAPFDLLAGGRWPCRNAT